MKFGVRVHDFGRDDVKILAKKVREFGFELIHLAVKKAFPGISGNIDIKEKDIENIKDAFSGIEISVLGSYIDFTTDDDEIWQNHKIEFIAAMRISKPLSALYIGSESSYGNISMEDKIRLFPKLIERLDDILNEADKYDVYVAMEPVAAHTLYCSEWTGKFLVSMEVTGFGL